MPGRMGPLLTAAALFLLISALGLGGVWLHALEERDNDMRIARQVGEARAAALVQQLDTAISATYTLAAVLQQNGYRVDEQKFQVLGNELLRYFPAAASLQYAPDGVIRYLVPLAGNEPALGHDLLADPKRNAEAFLAIDTRKLTLAGPFNLVQGGRGLVARLPVFTGPDRKDFWGFTTTLMKVDRLLAAAQMFTLSASGYDWAMWRIHPDNAKRQVFAGNVAEPPPDSIWLQVSVPNAQWFLALKPSGGWIGAHRWQRSAEVAMVLVIALLAAWLSYLMTRQPERLRQKVAERTEAMMVAQERLQLALDGAQAGLWFWQLPSGDVEFGERWLQMLGYQPGEIVEDYAAWEQRIHPDDLPLFHEALATHLSGDEAAFECTYRMQHREGRWVWLRTHGRVYETDVDGNPLRAAGTQSEITAQREIEYQQRKNQVLHETIFRALSEGVAQVDAGGVIRAVNPAAEQVLGRKADRLIGQQVRELHQHSVRADGRRYDLDQLPVLVTLKTGEPLENQIIGISGGGDERRWLRVSCHPLHDPSTGLVTGAVASFIDITQQKITEERMRELVAAVEQSPASVVICDVLGNIRYVNPQFEHATGYAASEVRGKNPRILKSGRTPPEEYERMWQTLTGGSTWRGEFSNRRKDGSLVIELASISPIKDDGGAIIGYVAVKEDITQRKRTEQVLRDNEESLRRAQAVANVGSWHLNIQTGELRWSEQTYRIFDMTPGRELKLDDFLGRIHPDDREMVLGAWQASVRNEQPYDIEHRILVGDQVRWVRERAELSFDLHGMALEGLGTVQDVTERHLSEQRLQEAAVAFEVANEGIMVTETDGRIVMVNRAFTQISGYSADELLGNTPAIMRSGRQDDAFYGAMWAALERDGHWKGEIWNRRKNGEVFPQWLNISAVRDAQGNIRRFVAVFSDITERKRQEQAIWRQANFDTLTGLANRALLQDRFSMSLASARRSKERVGLMLIDLDRFKYVNDSLGHDAGDALLVEMARRLDDCVRQQDTVARLGGDEFCVLLPEVQDAADLRPVANKILETLARPVDLSGTTTHVSGSIGVVMYPDDGEDPQQLMKHADIAMYQAKQAGRGCYQFFDHQMQDQALSRVRLESELRSAIEQQQFRLVYQPIIDADSGRLHGAEVLIRWQHPEHGLVSPLEFIPVAEDSGLIVPIGEWVLEAAARQWRAWVDAGQQPIQLSVNVSGVQFREQGLPEFVTGLRDRYRIDDGQLMLEITESVLMEGSQNAEARLRELKSRGVGYSLDDFGTGYSSLSYLKRFPVDVVKVDRSFTRDCIDDEADARLIEAITNMSHGLGLRVTVEGVENQEQLNLLRDLGCDYVQGYLFSKPLPAEQFEPLFDQVDLRPHTSQRSSSELQLLAALRDMKVDIDGLLEQLLAEHAGARHSEQLRISSRLDDMELREAVTAHLFWRRELAEYIEGENDLAQAHLSTVASDTACRLGQWISGRRQHGSTQLDALVAVHREFHAVAGEVYTNYQRGHRREAQRVLQGLHFRRVSRDVVLRLIDYYVEQYAGQAAD